MASVSQSCKRRSSVAGQTLALKLLVCVWAGWLALIRASIVWTVTALCEPSARGNAILLLLCVGIVVWRIGRAPRDFVFQPNLRLLPVLVFLLAIGGYLVVTRVLPIHRTWVLVAAVGTYGLLGLSLPQHSWRRALVPLLLCTALLPFAAQLDVYAGFPARLFTVEAASRLLAALGAKAVPHDTLLFFDAGVAQVGASCSGMRGLWTGFLLSLTATFVLERRLGWAWLGLNVAYVAALLAGNVMRIVVLALLAVAWHTPAAAELLHEPLGLVVFAFASLALLFGITRIPTLDLRGELAAQAVVPLRPLGLLLAAVLLAMASPAGARPVTVVANGTPLALPAALVGEPLPLSRREVAFFTEQGARAAAKHRFSWRRGDTVWSGSLLVVESDTFRAHHRPDGCLQALGLTIESQSTVLAAPRLPVRVLRLAHRQAPAVFWFQSPKRTTEDYASRVWGELGGDGPWVQVTLLVERGPKELPLGFIRALHHTVDTALTEEVTHE